ncbi:hypothetical protein [Maricaulis sp.]|uniref:hypothetical protein n=1 Tax=Maricaulis sp. TaxID=1486257 RepID=UPI003A92A996
MDEATLKRWIEVELAAASDRKIEAAIRRRLVEPEPMMRGWDYPGWRGAQAGTRYECWTVLKHPPSDTGICYCESGFGPENPWGLIFLTGDEARLSMGMDFGWYPTFLQAFEESMAVCDLEDR